MIHAFAFFPISRRSSLFFNKVISARAVVGSVQTPAEGVFGDGSQTIVVTVIVPLEEAAAVAAAGAAEQVSLNLLSRGEPVDSSR